MLRRGFGEAEPTRRLGICVLTFRRPEALERALEAIAELVVPAAVEVSLVVVDNDGANEPRPVERVGPFPVTWCVEPKRGIPHARNTAVAAAGDVDAVVFFDDDERPRPDCLEQLVKVWRTSGASVVQGSSTPDYESEPPTWVEAGGYFVREFDGDGDEIEPYRARSSNVLIARPVFDVADPPFDVRLGLTGGEDTHLFRLAHLVGHRFVAAPAAVVVESIPTTRMSSRWLIRREYRIGWSKSFFLRAVDGCPRRSAARVAKGMLTIARAPRHLMVRPLVWRRAATDIGRQAAHGVGLIRGLYQRGPGEYAVVDGC